MNDGVMRPGPRNLITDVPGIGVGNAEDHAIKSGTTVLTAERPFTAAVHVMGGAPGTRETDLLAPENTVGQVDALVLSGGSAFGLDAASGVVDALCAAGRGFRVGSRTVPIVPTAICFDLLNGGDKDWRQNPYAALGRAALAAAGDSFALGSAGAGTGATTAWLKGGLGSASALLPSGHAIGALAVVNAIGSANPPDSRRFWAASFELEAEFGGLGLPATCDAAALPAVRIAAREGTSTTIAIVATDAVLDKAGAKRLAIAAHDGMARALLPSHTPMDGDLVFAAATGTRPLNNPMQDLLILNHAAACCLSRAIARGVHAATPAPDDPLPCWSAL